MSKSINLDQKIEYKGYWYLPNKFDLKVAGIVTYYPNEKIILELIGSFYEDLEIILGNKNEPIIWGVTSESNSVTLIDCYPYSSMNFSAGFPITRYTCSYMVIGKHVESLEQKCQYSIRFKIPELSLWCHPAAIRTNAYFDQETQDFKSLCLSFNTEYHSKNSIIKDIKVNDDLSIYLKSGINFEETTYCLNPQLEQYTYVLITRERASSILELLSDMNNFEDFISLATLSTVYSSDITFCDNELYQLFEKKKYYKSIHLIYPRFEREEVASNKQKNYLFNYDTIKDIYANILSAWFNSPSDLYPIRNHLIDSLQKKKIYGSVDFLILIQAIEGFWWRFRDPIYHINNNISKKVKTSLKAILTELLKEYSDITLLSEAPIDIEAIVDSRHYYSHFLPKYQKPKFLEGFELYKESKKLRVLLICCILSFIGIKNPRINEIFKKSGIKLL